MENLKRNQDRIFSYTTPGGYTYPFLTENPLENEELKRVLDEAPEYKHYRTAYISKRLYHHIANKYHFGPNVDGTRQAIFNNVEVPVEVYDKNPDLGYLTIGIFCHPEGNEINDLFAKELGFKYHLSGKGLEKVLDKNYGGSLDPDTLRTVSIIIFG